MKKSVAIVQQKSYVEPEVEPQNESETDMNTENTSAKAEIDVDQQMKDMGYTPMDFPPALVGDVARHFENSSTRPVREVAITAALGLFAAISGRAYHINGSGLNQYFVLLAPTGIGKEAINSGISKLISSAAAIITAEDKTVEMKDVMSFIGPSSIASAPGIHTHISSTSKSFVSVIGEMGLWMASMTGQNASEHKKGLRGMLLDLYSKADLGNIMQSAAYAKKEDMKEAVKHPAMTIIGETTPVRFFEGLNEALISEGLMPRFTTIAYNGLRPRRKKGHYKVVPSEDVMRRFVDLLKSVMYFNNGDERVEVVMDDEGEELLDAFDIECDDAVNGGIIESRISGLSKEVVDNLWNRGHLKALRLAATIAVGMPREPGDEPTITKEVAEWAIKLIREDIIEMKNRFESGEVGEDVTGASERKQIDDMTKVIRDFVKMRNENFDSMKSYGVNANMAVNHIIPYTFFHRRLAKMNSFKKDRIGPASAIKKTLTVLIESGSLSHVDPDVMFEKMGSSGKGYKIMDRNEFKD